MQTLAMTLTRRNSRGVENKNTRTIAGKPLVQWTIEQALASKEIDRYVVATDDVKAMQIADLFDVRAIRLPAELTGDDSPIMGSIKYVVNEVGGDWDVVADIRTTNPLKTPQDIDAIIGLVKYQGAFVATGVTQAPPLERLKHLRYDLLVDVVPEPKEGLRQNLRETYTRNGSVYAMSWPAFEAGVLFGDGVVHAHFMPPERGVNIDTELDFAVAAMLLERNK